MITFELAKELKDAGFPQELKRGTWACEHGLESMMETNCSCYGEQLVHAPTLSELIEALPQSIADERGVGGECVFSLSVYEKKWTAMYDICDYQPLLRGEGNTPEEAVAYLYIALNKK